MTFCLFCHELCNLQMNCKPAVMPGLPKKFIAHMGTLSTARSLSLFWGTTLRKVVSLHLLIFSALITNLVTATLLGVASLMLGMYLCSFMLSPPKIRTVGLDIANVSYML